jgi:hypothetical protein
LTFGFELPRFAVAEVIADIGVVRVLEETKIGLSGVLAFLEDLTTIQNPTTKANPTKQRHRRRRTRAARRRRDNR